MSQSQQKVSRIGLERKGIPTESTLASDKIQRSKGLLGKCPEIPQIGLFAERGRN